MHAYVIPAIQWTRIIFKSKMFLKITLSSQSIIFTDKMCSKHCLHTFSLYAVEWGNLFLSSVMNLCCYEKDNSNQNNSKLYNKVNEVVKLVL